MSALGGSVTRVIRWPSPRARVIGRQLVAALLTLLAISFVVFALMSVRTPDEVARQVLGRFITTQQVHAFAQTYGLNRPLFDRYFSWLWAFLHGDMGTSYVTHASVASAVLPRAARTLILAFVSLAIALPLALAIGVFQAKRARSWSDMTLLTGGIVLVALPEFVIGVGLLFLFGVKLGWFPVDSGAALTFASSFGQQVKAYVLPVMTIVITTVPYLARIVRATVREALRAQSTQSAVLRGLPRRTVVWDHAMRLAGVPLVNAVSLNVAALLTGVIVAEWLFQFPGMGAYLVESISVSDTFTVEALAVIAGVIFIVMSFGADLIVDYLNPRLKAVGRAR